MINENDIKMLVEAAKDAMKSSYSPYSGFSVGAALLCADGSVYRGTNIENASYPAGICAERCALGSAIADGKRKFTAIAVCGGKNGTAEDECPPCGICRQVLSEFCSPEFNIILSGKSGYRVFTLSELLPLSFGKEKL